MSGFTPGPWDYDVEDFEIYALETFETLELTEPNARLIAAAPDLLEALDWLLASVMRDPSEENHPGDREDRILLACGSARVAIAKATGEAT